MVVTTGRVDLLMKFKKINFLVIGGNGFIGRHLVQHGLSLGWHVTSLSLNLPSKPINDDVNYLAVDITNIQALKSTIGNVSFTYVVNCGGYVDHSLFFDGGNAVFNTHFNGIVNLTHVLDRTALKAFVNIGSSDEYGNNTAPQNEEQRESPISSYSMGKVASTHFLQMLYRTEKFPAVTLRLFLTYGPGQDTQRFLPQIINGCLNDQTFPVSKGEQLRDFCYIDDTVNAVFSVFNNPNALGHVFNIASGIPVTIRTVIETVQKLTGCGKPVFGEIKYRTGENMELFADISKAKNILYWEPKVSLVSGIKETINWVNNHYHE